MRTIGIVGAGNLGSRLLQLLCRNNTEMFLTISDIDSVRSHELADRYEIEMGDNEHNIASSDVIFLSTKPNHIQDVCKEIKGVGSYHQHKIIISTAAGVPLSKIREWVGDHHHVTRCMPNIPISDGNGGIVWYGPDLDSLDRQYLDLITAGPASFWVSEESLIDSATVLSGCSPAYIANFFQIYMKMGQGMGFTEYETKSLLLGSFGGTVELLKTMEPEDIINQVASKGGATEKGIQQMADEGFEDLVLNAAHSSLKHIDRIKGDISDSI